MNTSSKYLLFFPILFVLLTTFVSAQIVINEIMFDPIGCSDNYCEWVEIFNNGTTPINISNWKLCSKTINPGFVNHSDGIVRKNEGFMIFPNTFALITDGGSGTEVYDNFQINNKTKSFYVGAGSICNSLTSTGKTIIILDDNNELVNSLNYTPFLSNRKEGFSLERISNLVWNRSALIDGTPGLINSGLINLTLNYSNNYSIDNPSNSSLPYFNESDDLIDICDWSIFLNISQLISSNKNFDFSVKVKREFGKKNNLTVRGTISDVFGHFEKKYTPFKNKSILNYNIKKYSPNLKEGIYKINFWIENSSCNDISGNNNQIEQLIAISPKQKKDDSFLNISRVYLGSDKSAKWGDEILSKIFVYTGNSTKTSILLWLEKDNLSISKRTKLNVYQQFKDYTLTVPIHIFSNCNQNINNGTATLIIEGLDKKSEINLTINGSDFSYCKNYFKSTSKNNIKEDKFKLINFSSVINSGSSVNFLINISEDGVSHEYLILQYLYKGNTCYSCLNKTNFRNSTSKKHFLLANKSKIISARFDVDSNIPNGEYKLKIKIKKDNHLIPIEVTKDIYVVSNDFSCKDESNITTRFQVSNNTENSITGAISKNALYHSSLETSKRLVSIFLVISLILLIFLTLNTKN